MTQDRNPYIMLGIPFGSPRDVATRSFARKAKGRRRRVSESRDLTELTWALNQVEENIREPRTALHIYRVPANAAALEPQGEGLLRPGPEPMARTTESSAPAWGRLLDGARAEALAALHDDVAASAALPPR